VGYAVGWELAQEKRKDMAMLWGRWRGLRWLGDGEFRRWVNSSAEMAKRKNDNDVGRLYRRSRAIAGQHEVEKGGDV
jgi:hypothetical protein